MDYSIYKAINGLTGSAAVDDVMRFLANNLSLVLVILVSALFLVPWRQHRWQRRCGAVAATAAAAIALLVNQPIANAVMRARPYAAHPAQAHLLIAPSHDPSFPSDHATGAFALATAVVFYDRVAGAVLFFLALLLAFSRVYVGIHYPGDVAGGAVIGAAVALALRLPMLRRLLERFAEHASNLWDRALRFAHLSG